MKTARIIFLTEEFPPLIGGVGVSSERVAKSLSDFGLSVVVFTFDSSRQLAEDDYVISESVAGIRVLRFGPFFLRQSDPQALRLGESAKAAIRRRVFDQMERSAGNFQPQVVLSFNAVNAGLLGAYLANSFGIPHIASIRGVDVGRNVFSFTEMAILRTIVENSSYLVCVNEHLRKRLVMAFPSAARISGVIHNATELPAGIERKAGRELVHQRTGWDATHVVAVFIGAAREKKGIKQLLTSISALREKTSIRLLIVGSPLNLGDPSWGKIATELLECGAVCCTGHLPRNEALHLAGGGDIIVMPSVEDGLANGLLEGMALGLCPIVSDIFADVVDSTCGYVVPRNDVDSLTSALIECHNNPDCRNIFGQKAKERIREKHSIARECNEYVEIIDKVSLIT